MSKVLVTGASGFVGRALVGKLREAGADFVATSSRPDQAGTDARTGVRLLTWRCEQPGAVRELLQIFRGEGVTAVIHLAAVARPMVASADPARTLAVNVGGTNNLLEAVRLAETRIRTLIVSTMRLPDADPRRWLPYFASKRAAEELAISYRRTFGLPVSVARLGTVYGPDSGRTTDGLIPGIIDDLRHGLAPQLREPDALVDLVHIEDAVGGLLAALDQPADDDFDIATGELVRAVDVASFLEGLVTGREHQCPPSVAVGTDLVRPAGWSPGVTLRSGLARMADTAPASDVAGPVPSAGADPPAGIGRDRARPVRRPAASEFGGYYAGRRVLVTGSTGFKGSWLALWLAMLGADVTGFALAPPGDRPSHFELIDLGRRIRQVFGDVTDQHAVSAVMRECEPDIVFHLAAQPLVGESMRHPAATFLVNTMGTVNVLDAARGARSLRSVVCITSDKCYQNQEWVWGYRETDSLGGDDPYSASKAAAELAIASFRATIYPDSAADHVCIASARAGNVIGGGDWAAGRLVPDVVRWATSSEPQLVMRNPRAVRPWQHVLEPLSGYLWLGRRESDGMGPCRCAAWNFGPSQVTTLRAGEVAARIAAGIGRPLEAGDISVGDAGLPETTTLRLDSQKAAEQLGWRATWMMDEAIDAAARWYARYYNGAPGGMAECSQHQISAYADAARHRGLAWARTP